MKFLYETRPGLEFLYYLEPEYDSAKSFYKKAQVLRDNNGKLYLMSYATIVAEIIDAIAADDHCSHLIVRGWYSQTTARHINEFALQHSFPKMNKKEMERRADDIA